MTGFGLNFAEALVVTVEAFFTARTLALYKRWSSYNIPEEVRPELIDFVKH